jgi:hypothetical protein
LTISTISPDEAVRFAAMIERIFEGCVAHYKTAALRGDLIARSREKIAQSRALLAQPRGFDPIQHSARNPR